MPTGLEIQYVLALRGPNIWARFPVLEVWVHLHDLKDVASSELPGFNDRLQTLLPSLVNHRCSVGEPGGFFQRLERGTYLAHVFEHVAIELQALAGSDVGFGKTRMTRTDGVYKIGLEYEDEETGRAACHLAQTVCHAAVTGGALDLAGGIERLRAILARNRPSPAVAELLDAAKAASVPAQLIDPAAGLVRLGTGANQRRVMGGQTDRTSAVGAHVAKDRVWTRDWLAEVGLPVPAGGRAAGTADEAWAIAQQAGLPVVLRPRYTADAAADTPPLTSEAEVREAFDRLYPPDRTAGGWTTLVDHAPAGAGSYRLLTVGGKLAAALDGDGRDVTDRVHTAVADRAADAAFALRLDVAVVEVFTTDPGRPLEEAGGTICGVDAQPDLAAFREPAGGQPRPVGRTVIDALFPDPRASRIPVVAVTGTNGKTTTTRLTAHLLGQVWQPVGMCCTECVEIGGRRVWTGDCSGPRSARVVLQHPEVRAAALETARGGILHGGLAFDRCDVSVVTNIGQGDHLGDSWDVETPEELADVKATIVWATAPWGAAVLNAADPLVVGMRKYCEGAVVFFGRDETNPVIRDHRSAGGRAVFVRGSDILLAEGATETILIGLDAVPLTHGGRVPFQVENTLAGSAAAWSLGVPIDAIRHGLATFRPSLDQVPGRFNLLDVAGVTVVLDYGHNVSALHRLFEVLGRFPHPKRTAVYSAAGDRRDRDMVDQGELLGRAFDRVVLYEDTYLRGRAEGDISRLFREGLARGGRTQEVTTVKGGMEAIAAALAVCRPGELLLVQPDRIEDGVAFLKQFLSTGGREITMSQAIEGGPQINPEPAPAARPAAGAVHVGQSRLGRAAFATRPLAAGEVVAGGWGPVTDVRSRYTMQVDDDLHLDPPSPVRFFNHSCDPNCGILIRTGVEWVEVHTLRDVDPGEELTLDYETFETEFAALVGPCECAAPACRGRLRGYAALSPERRARYGRYVAEYLREADTPHLAPRKG